MTTIQASLRIIGDDFSPDEITNLLQVEPSLAHERGDKNFGRDNREYASFPTSLWALDSTLAEDEPLANHLNHLLSQVDAERIKAIATKGYKVDLFIGVFSSHEPTAVEIPGEIVKRIASIDALLDISFYPD